MLSERLGRWHLVLTFVGFQVTFLVQHILGLEGMPRRVVTLPGGRRLRHPQPRLVDRRLHPRHLGACPFFWNLWRSWRHGEPCGDNPWDGQTLEWWTSSPPPPENCDRPLPPIRSERPSGTRTTPTP